MPNWDDSRGPWREDERDRERWRQDRWRREAMRSRREWQGGERDAERFGDSRQSYRGEPYAYAGQEYGLEGHPGVSGGYSTGGPPRGGDWRFGRSTPEFDPEYLQWREEQLRAHDRDYDDWRREQHRQYDDQYRQYRSERQRHFGEAFHQWRSQRSMVGGAPDTAIGTVGQGQGGYGDKTGIPGGYNAASAYDRPSGYLDPPGHLSADPAMSQVGGGRGGHTAMPPTGDRSPEFGREPPQVKAAADGDAQGHERQRRADEAEREKDAAKRQDSQRH